MSPTLGPESTLGSPARWLERATPSQLIALQWFACLVMVFVMLATPVLSGRSGMMNLTESWGALERVSMWQRAMSWIPGVGLDGGSVTLPVGLIAWSFRAALLLMFALHAWAFWLAWVGRHTNFRRWIIGPIGAQFIMILFIPSNADIFFYELSGDIANSGYNPYTHYIYEFGQNPLLPYNHWVDMTTVYGPFWTDINRVIMAVTGPDPIWATVVYKVFLGSVAIAAAALVYWFAKRLTGSTQLGTAAGVLVAWQPNMIIESAGQAHNDILVILLSTLGVVLAVMGGANALRGAIVLVTLSATVKYVTLPLVGVLGLLRIADRHKPNALRRIVGSWALDGAAILAVLIATFLPYWAGLSTFQEMFFEPGRLFAHPIWLVPYLLMLQILPGGIVDFYVVTTRIALQLATVGLLVYTAWKLTRSLWTSANVPDESTLEGAHRYPWWTRRLLVTWAALMAILALVPANSHAWYWTWTVAPIAVLISFDRTIAVEPGPRYGLPRWFWWYVSLICVMTLIYHTRVVHS